MHDLYGHSIAVFMSFFAIMNPIANTPIFLALTAGDSKIVKKQVAINSLLLAFAIIAVFCLLGKQIFELFGITLPVFRITGGVLLAKIGFDMLHGKSSNIQQPSPTDQKSSQQDQLSVAISPLAVPILAGPGTIATAVNFGSMGGVKELIISLGAFGVLCCITFLCFIFGEVLVRFLGQNGLNVITRLMGLILAAVGVGMLAQGIKLTFGLS